MPFGIFNDYHPVLFKIYLALYALQRLFQYLLLDALASPIFFRKLAREVICLKFMAGEKQPQRILRRAEPACSVDARAKNETRMHAGYLLLFIEPRYLN